jgi:hypothetical protein
MLRIIVREDNFGMAAHVGGPVQTTFKTFDVELPECEQFILEFEGVSGCYVTRTISGVEVITGKMTDEQKAAFIMARPRF